MAELALIQHVRGGLLAFLPTEHAPATSWIGAHDLANPDFLIKIEALAVIE